MYDKAVTRDVTQNRIMIAYKHFKVTISLYLSLNKRARGLSTLIMTQWTKSLLGKTHHLRIENFSFESAGNKKVSIERLVNKTN